MQYKYKVLSVIAPLILILDQWTKQIVLTTLALGEKRIFIDGFWDWVHVRNSGAAFGLLAQTPDWLREPFFYSISVVALVVIVWVFVQMKNSERLLPFPFALILGGLLGNGIDRIRFGNVVDFVSWHVGDKVVAGIELVWPAFNVADSAITTAMVLLILQMWKGNPKSS